MVNVNVTRYWATQNRPVLGCSPCWGIVQRCCYNGPQVAMIQSGTGLGVVVQYWLFAVPQFAPGTRTSDKLLSLKYSRIIWKYVREKAMR